MALIHAPPIVSIAGRPIGPGHAPYVIAEMSGNHNGDLQRALQILDEVKRAGADAVKLQTYRADTITIDHDGPEFFVRGGLWDARRLYDLYEEAHTPWEWHAPLFAYAQKIGLTVFSSPFDPTAVDFLAELDVPAFKIASPEIVDIPLIRHAAGYGKPLIISTGMASLEEIELAVKTAKAAGDGGVILLHCTSAYPTPPNEANLSTIVDLAERFGVVVGLSDHTLDTTVATIAVALGACVVEKHFTLARADGGVDSAFSLEPAELARLVQDVAVAHVVRGQPAYTPTQSEANVLRNRRSLYVVADIQQGETLTSSNIRSIRPANGLAPKYWDQVIGRRATRDLVFGEPLSWSMVEGGQPLEDL